MSRAPEAMRAPRRRGLENRGEDLVDERLTERMAQQIADAVQSRLRGGSRVLAQATLLAMLGVADFAGGHMNRSFVDAALEDAKEADAPEDEMEAVAEPPRRGYDDLLLAELARVVLSVVRERAKAAGHKNVALLMAVAGLALELADYETFSETACRLSPANVRDVASVARLLGVIANGERAHVSLHPEPSDMLLPRADADMTTEIYDVAQQVGARLALDMGLRFVDSVEDGIRGGVGAVGPALCEPPPPAPQEVYPVLYQTAPDDSMLG